MPDTPRELHLLAPAKINFSLGVVGKRADGYHDLRMLMAPVSLYDELLLTRLGEPGRIEVRAAAFPDVEEGENNLCHRAAAYFFRATGVRGGVSVKLTKTIPVGAGMGGGSSDAAAVLMGLERLFDHPLGEAARERAAFEVGADVPFFFARGPAWVEGVGERVTPLAALEELWLVVVHPGVFLSTAAVFSRHNKELTTPGEVHNITQFDFQGVASVLSNDLEPAARALEPEVGRAIECVRAAGCRAALMTGSGAAVFGLCADEAEARRVADAVGKSAPAAWRVMVLHTLGRAPLLPDDLLRWGVGKR